MARRFALTLLCASFLLLVTSLQAQRAQPTPRGIPQYRVDPFWPQELPQNWILG